MEQAINVKAIREGLGLTQAQFGDMFGVDQSTISNWEKGETRPRGPALKMIEAIVAQATSAPARRRRQAQEASA